MQIQNKFAGIKPYCDVCNAITQTMTLLMPETTRPVHNFFPTRSAAITVRNKIGSPTVWFLAWCDWLLAVVVEAEVGDEAFAHDVAEGVF
jgi:hypothetical protein